MIQGERGFEEEYGMEGGGEERRDRYCFAAVLVRFHDDETLKESSRTVDGGHRPDFIRDLHI